MPADQAAGSASILLLLLLGVMGAFAGLGIMMGAGSNKKGEGGSGMNAGRIVTVLVIGVVVAMWLSAPGTGQGIAAVISAMWANLVIGLQPLVSIATQLAMVAVVAIVGFYAVRRFLRHR